ncbi:VOC family protein [Pseudonocardia spinosispora]|uniref:VOC family protein n=1 Tax=Pseudonocardia spinosispora TaxID=103441 RepID=UPI000415560F|nr:VOC family protein [Pseudonocardia spinosispora]
MADHSDLHSEHGARRGEHPGRARNPIMKVHDLAWLEFEKPDLARAERFAHAFGFSTTLRTDSELHLRGTDAGAPCVLIRKGPGSRFLGPTFLAGATADLHRLAGRTGRQVRPLAESLGGSGIELTDPTGLRVSVVADVRQLDPLPQQAPHDFNSGHRLARSNAIQRPPREPARVQRVGHVVLQSTRYSETLNWYLEHFGLIVSDFQYYEGQRERGPTMSFVRCDRGATPADHHTLAMALGPADRYLHSAYQVADLDALAAGGRHLGDEGYHHSWGVGRHVEGSQIFDYWRDPDGFLVEHFSDGDMFDDTVETGWSPFTASGLAQWGPAVTKDFLGLKAGRGTFGEVRSLIEALRGNNEFDLERLRGLITVTRT